MGREMEGLEISLLPEFVFEPDIDTCVLLVFVWVSNINTSMITEDDFMFAFSKVFSGCFPVWFGRSGGNETGYDSCDVLGVCRDT